MTPVEGDFIGLESHHSVSVYFMDDNLVKGKGNTNDTVLFRFVLF